VISIGFSYRSGNLVSWVIRKMTHSDVSHAWLLVDDVTLRGKIVMEAGFAGWETESYEQFLAQNTVVATIDMKCDLSKGIEAAREWLGSSYDFMGLLGAFVVIVGRWFKFMWHNPFNSSKTLFCSEAIARVLQEANYPGAASLDPGTVTPQDLYTFLKNSAS